MFFSGTHPSIIFLKILSISFLVKARLPSKILLTARISLLDIIEPSAPAITNPFTLRSYSTLLPSAGAPILRSSRKLRISTISRWIERSSTPKRAASSGLLITFPSHSRTYMSRVLIFLEDFDPIWPIFPLFHYYIQHFSPAIPLFLLLIVLVTHSQ